MSWRVLPSATAPDGQRALDQHVEDDAARSPATNRPAPASSRRSRPHPWSVATRASSGGPPRRVASGVTSPESPQYFRTSSCPTGSGCPAGGVGQQVLIAAPADDRNLRLLARPTTSSARRRARRRRDVGRERRWPNRRGRRTTGPAWPHRARASGACHKSSETWSQSTAAT